MRKLNFAPDQQGYQVQDSSAHVQTKLGGGMSRIRKDYLNAPVLVDLQWTCDPQEYNYLQTFWRIQQDGTEPFLMDLIIHSNEILEHECKFVPDTFRFTGITGERFVVKAKLEVVPPIPDDAMDEGVVTTFESFGDAGSQAYALLATLVNVTCPDNLK